MIKTFPAIILVSGGEFFSQRNTRNIPTSVSKKNQKSQLTQFKLNATDAVAFAGQIEDGWQFIPTVLHSKHILFFSPLYETKSNTTMTYQYSWKKHDQQCFLFSTLFTCNRRELLWHSHTYPSKIKADQNSLWLYILPKQKWLAYQRVVHIYRQNK